MNATTYRFATNLGKQLVNLKHALTNTTQTIDKTLHTIGDTQLEKNYQKRHNLAMQNPEYADIEQRRKLPNTDNMILYSEEANLTWEHYETQHKIFNQMSKPHPLTPIYKHLTNYPIKTLTNKIKHAHQRLTRSWDETATWSLDHHLTLTLSQQLHHLAETTHGWPQSETYPQFENWQQALHENAKHLENYANMDTITAHKHSHNYQTEQQIIQNAQKALHWVAENLTALWD